MLLSLVFATLLIIRTVSGGIYSTFPIARSVLNAGRLNTLHWIDDKEWPSVNGMGPVRIDLYVGDTYVCNLADEVDPRSLSADVWVSPSWRYNSSDYYLRFICEQPHTIAYTARFTITGMSNLLPFDGPTIDAHNQSAVSISYVAPKLTIVRPNATSTSALKPMSTTSVAAPPIASLENVQRTHQGKTGSAAGLRKRPTVDLERLKFRFVFIFWPTLIGITMAL